MPLSILQCSEQPLTTNYLAQNVSTAEVKKPCCNSCCLHKILKKHITAVHRKSLELHQFFEANQTGDVQSGNSTRARRARQHSSNILHKAVIRAKCSLQNKVVFSGIMFHTPSVFQFKLIKIKSQLLSCTNHMSNAQQSHVGKCVQSRSGRLAMVG